MTSASPVAASVARPLAHTPLVPAHESSELTTAAPFAVATPAVLEVAQARATRPRGMLGIAVATAAVLAIGIATWWIASRDAHPTAIVVAPSAVARPALPSAREPAAERPVSPPIGAPAVAQDPAPVNAGTPASATGPTNAGTPANATGPTAGAPTNSPEPANAPVPNARAPVPAFPGVAGPRPKHIPIRHGYDPQGI